MKKAIIAIAILALILMNSLPLVQTAFAAEETNELTSIAIPVGVELSGGLPEKPEEFILQLIADDNLNPMPEGSKDGIYSLTIKGAAIDNFPKIVFDKVGIYSYQIKQIKGNNDLCTYDDTVYELTIYVTNAESGSGLTVSAILYPEVSEEKLASAVFSNSYVEQTVTTTTKTEITTTETKSKLAPNTGENVTGIILVVILLAIVIVLITIRKYIKNRR